MTDVREKFIDYDARREPKTNTYCVQCQRDLTPDKPMRHVYVTDQMHSVHPEDLKARGTLPTDYGWLLMGMDCAKRHGMEWTCDAPFDVNGS